MTEAIRTYLYFGTPMLGLVSIALAIGWILFNQYWDNLPADNED